jgi:cytochrome c oxidase subunit 2
MTTAWVRRVVFALVVGLLTLAAAGCGSGDQSAINPAAPQARDIKTLWWWMLAVAVVIFVGAVALLGLGWLRRGTRGLPVFGERENVTVGLVVLFGIAVPLVTLVTLFTTADVFLITKTDQPARAATGLSIAVTGHQWFWEVRYPGTTAVTANEIHIPVGTKVDVALTTADVIHSFWVPQLNRKLDMVPGQVNHLLLEAEKPGVFRGQCAEFCGVQHAHMAMFVYADPPDRFKAWLASESKPAAAPTTAAARGGAQVFLSQPCASCHTIRGTDAQGEVGPDLTHLASRTTLAAATIPNDYGQLAAWVFDPQHVKPGNRMPAVPLAPDDFRNLIAYLESLK